MLARLAACSAAALLVSAGLAVTQALATPPTKIVPPPASQLQPTQKGNHSPGTGTSSQPSSELQAALRAMQQRMAQLVDPALANYKGPYIDGSMSQKNVASYLVPMRHGTVLGVMSLPGDAKIGAWLKGGSTASGSGANAKPGTGTPTSAPANPAAPASEAVSALPQLLPTEMTPQALADAMKKYPSSEGWRTLWLGDNGKLFVKGDPCQVQSIETAFRSLDAPREGASSDVRLGSTVNDYANTARSSYDSQIGRRGAGIVQGSAPQPTRKPAAPAPAASGETTAPNKYTLDAPAAQLAEQAAAIRQTMSVASDDGRLERSLALTEIAQPLWRSEGLKRLASVYLAHPDLLKAAVESDFDRVELRTLRAMVVRAVTEAHRSGDGRLWVAVAALMAAEKRPEQALSMLARASKAITDDATLDKIDELGAVLRNMKSRP